MEDQKPAGDNKPTETGDDAAQKNNAAADDKAGGQQPSDNKPDGGEQKPAESKQDPVKPQDDEPPVRKTKLDFIQERKQRQLEKAKSQEITKTDEEIRKIKENGGAPIDEDEEDIDPEEEAKISKVIDKKYGHVFEGLEEKEQEAEAQKDEAELQTFLTTNPSFKPYEAKIRKFAQHESRKHLPLISIAYEIAGPDLERLGAEKERKAAADAAASTTGGGSTRTDGAVFKPINEMTKPEFDDFTAKVRRGEVQWPGQKD